MKAVVPQESSSVSVRFGCTGRRNSEPEEISSMIPFVFLFLCVLPAIESAEEQLLFAQVLFRHGARAPSERFTNESFSQLFPRGLGELTDRGFENSYLLGKFLKKRYVDTGFLDSSMQPLQMYWRSVNKNRCLSTASTVGAAMFEHPDRHLHVAVYTEETAENLLNYDIGNCVRETELVKEKCPGFTGVYDPWPKYEEFVANCLNFTHPVLEKYPFHSLEAYLNEYKNGIPLPEPLAQNIDEITKMYASVTQWITGTGRYHDPRKMKIKFVNLMIVLLSNMKEFWTKVGSISDAKQRELLLESKRIPKFEVYSTQDWMLMGVLEAFGVLEESVGLDAYPEYNSMIILELWEKDRKPFVKMYFKPEEKTEEDHNLIDLSNTIRECPKDKSECPLKKFVSCCSEYIMALSCESAAPQSNFVSPRRKKRFAGPE